MYKRQLEDYKKNFCFPVETYWKKIGFSLTEDEFNKKNALRLYFFQEFIFLQMTKLLKVFDLILFDGQPYQPFRDLKDTQISENHLVNFH